MQKLGVRGSYFCSSVSFSKTRQTFDTYRPNKDVKFRPFVKMPSPNELNKLPKSFWMCHKKASFGTSRNRHKLYKKNYNLSK